MFNPQITSVAKGEQCAICLLCIWAAPFAALGGLAAFQ